MLKVVTNTTPIISLLKLNRLDLLHKIYEKIKIPEAVFNDIEAGSKKKYYKNIKKFNWINIVEIQDKKALNYFLDLDIGEAEAIVLASEIDTDLLIIDEKLGRYHAKHANLKIIGTLGVLIKAKKLGYINSLKPIIDELSEKGIWIDNNLKKTILQEVDEL